MVDEPAITTDGLTCRFGSVTVVKDLSLTIPEGCIYAFVGRNGAGKTTTIRSLMGMIPSVSGRARILGYDPFSEGEKVRQLVGYLPESRSLYGYMQVRELLKFARSLRCTWDDGLVAGYMERFGIPAEKPVSQLSAGMRTQLGLILALAHRPRVLLLDEPVAHLDLVRIRDLFNVILEEVAEEGRTVLLSSHALHLVERVSDHVGIIDAGRLVMQRPAEDLRTEAKQVRVAFQIEPPGDIFEHPDVVNVRAQGKKYLVTVEGSVQELVARFSEVPHFALEVVDMDLEEIFLEYAGRGEEESGRET